MSEPHRTHTNEKQAEDRSWRYRSYCVKMGCFWVGQWKNSMRDALDDGDEHTIQMSRAEP